MILRYSAAAISRGLVDASPNFIATMATVYPSDHSLAGTRPKTYGSLVAELIIHFTAPGQPFALQEYYASCFTNGSILLLVLPISRHTQNILRSPGRTASLTMASSQPAASHARVSLMGNVTIFQDWDNVPDEETIKACYLAQHPDARRWLPNDDDAAHIVSNDSVTVILVVAKRNTAGFLGTL